MDAAAPHASSRVNEDCRMAAQLYDPEQHRPLDGARWSESKAPAAIDARGGGRLSAVAAERMAR